MIHDAVSFATYGPEVLEVNAVLLWIGQCFLTFKLMVPCIVIQCE